MTAATVATAFTAARLSQRHGLVILRLAAGWSQRELARRARVSEHTLSTIEQRHRPPSMPVRRRLLHALGVPLGRHFELFGQLPSRQVKSVR